MDADQVVPPPGYTLDSPQPTPTPTRQQKGIGPPPNVVLPPGYTLDAPKPSQQSGIAAPQQRGIGHTVGQWWDQVNPMGMVKTASDFVSREPQDLMISRPARDVYNAGKDLVVSGAEDLGAGNTGRGIRKIISGFIPVIGPSLNKAGQQAEDGDYSGALGTTAGIATNLAMGKIGDLLNVGVGPGIRSGMQGIARSQYRKALKPPPTYDVGEVQKAVTGGLQGEIPVSSEGIAKRTDLQAAGRGKIDTLVDSTGAQQNIPPPIGYLPELEQSYKLGGRRSTTNPGPAIADVRQVGQGIVDQLAVPPSPPGAQGPPGIRNMTAREAQNLKTGLNAELADSYGELSTATKTAKKAVVRHAKDSLNTAFPELEGLNAEQGGLIALDPLLERRVNGELNRDPMGLIPSVTAGVVHAATSSVPAAMSAGFLKRVIDTPLIRSKLAIALNRASKGAVSLPAAKLRVAGYIDALGNEDSGQDNGGRTSQ